MEQETLPKDQTTLHSIDTTHDFTAFVQKTPDGHYEAVLRIEGIRCAGCIATVEKALYAFSDVTHARVNMSLGQLSVHYKGHKNLINELAENLSQLGYHVASIDKNTTTEQDTAKMLLICIAVSGFAAGNLMMISVGLWSTTSEIMGMATQKFLHMASLLIALPAIIYAGRPFFYSALGALRHGHTNMDVPISLAVILASTISVMETIRGGEYIYFDSAVMLVFFLLIGRYLDAKAKGKAKSSAQDLLKLLHSSATILENGNTRSIPLRDIREGMTVLVAVGQTIPADGVVSNGSSECDMSLITGETLPQTVHPGDTVFAGTVNQSAPLTITVSKASKDSLLSDIIKLMEKAGQTDSTFVRIADKAAKLYTPVVHSVGLITFLLWWLVLGHDWQPSLLIAITVLIITCPCALGLAVPVVQVLASSRLMKQGILLKSGDALEKLTNIDTIIFDKTGTLTLGKPSLDSSISQNKHFQIAASLASYSIHPLSKAIVAAYKGTILPASNIKEYPGKGIQGTIAGQHVKLGSRQWCGDDTAPTNHEQLEMWFKLEDMPPVMLSFTDALRPGAKEVVASFEKHNILSHLLSGDRPEAVQYVANTVGITHYHASYSPVQKCDYISKIQQQGHHVLMVGDGLNDAPSLATANVSMSPSSAVDISINTADIVFQQPDLRAVSEVWHVALQTQKLVKQNFLLAIIYNLFAIPLAVMGYVTPMIAAIAMSASSLVVIGNSFRLRLPNKKAE